MPALDTITNTLNYYGGGISLVSLVFSVFLAVLTGNIKKNIKLILEHKDLNVSASKEGVVHNRSFFVILTTDSFEALFISYFKPAGIR